MSLQLQSEGKGGARQTTKDFLFFEEVGKKLERKLGD